MGSAEALTKDMLRISVANCRLPMWETFRGLQDECSACSHGALQRGGRWRCPSGPWYHLLEPCPHPSATLYLIFRACLPNGSATCVHMHSRRGGKPLSRGGVPACQAVQQRRLGCTPRRRCHAMHCWTAHPQRGYHRNQGCKGWPLGQCTILHFAPPQQTNVASAHSCTGSPAC